VQDVERAAQERDAFPSVAGLTEARARVVRLGARAADVERASSAAIGVAETVLRAALDKLAAAARARELRLAEVRLGLPRPWT
jgi:hypothetical protein